MQWNKLSEEENLQTLIEESFQHPVVIFKHSTRCSISSMAWDRMKRSWNDEEMKDVKRYFLDIISNRPISNKVAEIFNVVHESPQLLVISKGVSIYDTSHMGISYNELKKRLEGSLTI